MEVHPDKTGIVYGKDSNRGGEDPPMQCTLLGFTFRPRRAQNRAGELLMSCLPGARGPAQQRMRPPSAQWPLPRQTSENLRTSSTPSHASLAGWGQYDGRFSPTAVWTGCRHFDLTLARGACRQYKTLRGHRRRSRRWLAKVARRESELVVHWRLWDGMAREGEPCASRGSRTVLRAAEGAVPLADSPTLTTTTGKVATEGSLT